MTYTRKLWRAEIVYLVRKREKLMIREYHAASMGQARQIALLVRGAVRVNRIEEIKEESAEARD